MDDNKVGSYLCKNLEACGPAGVHRYSDVIVQRNGRALSLSQRPASRILYY